LTPGVYKKERKSHKSEVRGIFYAPDLLLVCGFFCAIGNSVGIPYYIKKPYRAGSHCGGKVDVAEGDPPQAENPAKQDSFLCYMKCQHNQEQTSVQWYRVNIWKLYSVPK